MTARDLFNKIDDLVQEGEDYARFYPSKNSKKSYHAKDDEEWAQAQLCIEDFIGAYYRTRRISDTGRIDWKRLWKIFEHYLKKSDIGEEWDEQKIMVVYLISLFLNLKEMQGIENIIVNHMFEFINEETPHQEDAEFNQFSSVSIVKRTRFLMNGLNSNLAEKLENKFKHVDFFRGVKKQMNEITQKTPRPK